MSNKTYITDDHSLNDSSIAASSKAISNGLSALMDNIIVAANAAANSQTTIPNNNAVELSNRIEQVAAKNVEQDTAIAGKLDKSGGTMTGDILLGNRGKISIDESADYVVLTSYTDSKIGAKVICRGLNAPVRPGSVLLIGRTSDGLEGTPVWVMPDGNIEVNGKNVVRTVNGTAADASGNVSVSAGITTVKGEIGSAVASTGTSMTLPSGGTWAVFNAAWSGTSGNNAYGVSKSSSGSSGSVAYGGGTYSGGTTVYATRTSDDGMYSASGKLIAVRIS